MTAGTARRSRRLLSGFAACLALAAIVVCPSPAYAKGCEAESRDDPMPQTPWPLERMRPERMWPLTRGEDMKVAVIDSGVGEHPILKGRVKAVDYTEDKLGARCDMASHGTLVAGIIAGADTSDSPFHGLAPDASILSYRVIDTVESATSRDAVVPVVDAIRDAVDKGADVINLSLTSVHTTALQEAIEYAHRKDVVVVAAAGNSGAEGRKSYPAAYDTVIAVAGLRPNGEHVESSSIGDYVDIAAPGEQIDGPAPSGGGYGRREKGGTSFAAPYVSATAALLKSYYPKDSPEETAARMLVTADHPPGGRNQLVGYGELNPYRALTTVLTAAEKREAITPDAPQQASDPGAVTRKRALLFTACAAALVLVFLAAKVIVPRGRNRRWRCP
ncbi:type VII secretion-associated serine protease mycosin [Stackebrandtia nassauensis]|uniref:type VII secretion-associated serine protease mycosin n=1 Tax=Stackebrandtia nassauensis TaxID=283811 RepID=UPI000323DA58|nr:type VII secretion-associated serine protease mycosin [Stackebrandtia nassauensis]